MKILLSLLLLATLFYRPIELQAESKTLKNVNQDQHDLTILLNSADLPLKDSDDVKFIVSVADISFDLTNQDVEEERYTINVEKNEDGWIDEYKITIKDLKPKAYRLAISANGYKGLDYDFNMSSSDKYMAMSSAYTLLAGDLDGDGEVSRYDYDLMYEHLNTKDERYDLNKDGKVDLVDLSQLHRMMDGTVLSVNEVDKVVAVDLDEVVMEAAADVEVKGELESIIDGRGEVVLEKSEAITSKNPLTFDMELKSEKVMDRIQIQSDAKRGSVIVETSKGEVLEIAFDQSRLRSNVTEIDLGKQVAVKKIKFKITDTNNPNQKLSSIAKVEFINEAFPKIPRPQANYPKNIKAVAKSEEIILTWDRVMNVRGYHVQVTYIDPKSNTLKTIDEYPKTNSLVLSDLKNYVTYSIKIRSVADNGTGEDWYSEFSQTIQATPKPAALPPAVDNVVLEGGYRSIEVNWKKMEDTLTYNLYYGVVGRDEVKKISGVDGTSYLLENLEDCSEYFVYVSGNNEMGEGPKSIQAIATTIELTDTIVSKYKLINRQAKEHIKAVSENKGQLLEEGMNLFDYDESTYLEKDTWDTGGYNSGQHGFEVEFDQVYELGEFILVPSYNKKGDIMYQKVQYWDENGNEIAYEQNIDRQRLTDKNGKVYYRFILSQPIATHRIRINLANYSAGGNMNIAEVRFYEFDDITERIEGLFVDDLKVELKPSVNKTLIQMLRDELDAGDPISKELHPNYSSLISLLDYALQLLQDGEVADVIEVNTKISTVNDGYLGFASSLSDLQPLGISAVADEEIVVYVGSENGKEGSSSNLSLVATQFHPESNAWLKEIDLKIGRNEITIPRIGTGATQRGGALYVRYKGKTSDEQLSLRVSGGVSIPLLDLSGLLDGGHDDEARAVISAYLSDLQAYMDVVKTYYDEGEFDERNSVLNTTDIVTDKVMLSIPASVVHRIYAENKEQQVELVLENALALEQIARLSYAQKGLSDEASEAIDRMPLTRLNIRYHRMFAGAFMYAGGKHIGVEFDSVAGLLQGKPYVYNEVTQRYENGSLYGWGIAHEIGHVIDQKQFAYAETTNNLFALFAQTLGEDGVSRIGSEEMLEKIYAKVTSNTVGKVGNVFTQLGMYWQLHLAYDLAFNGVENTDTFYARLHKNIRRNQYPNGKDTAFILAASDAAKKDLSEFFIRWGYEIDEETRQYLQDKAYPKEERKIYYLDEKARLAQIENRANMAEGTKVSAIAKWNKEASVDVGSQFVDFELSVNQSSDRILGYEIIRNGQVVAFVHHQPNEVGITTYRDALGTFNNRVVSYEVIAYDYALNPTSTLKISPFKVSHDGTMAKENWEIASNVESDAIQEGNEEQTKSEALLRLINNDYKDSYHAKQMKGNIVIDVNLNHMEQVAGWKATAPIDTSFAYSIEVSEDGKSWNKVLDEKMELMAYQTKTVYFGEPQTHALQIVNASHVRFTFKTDELLLSELDLIAPPGDDVNLTSEGIGILKEDYAYDEENIIPEGSLIFVGDYRGHPAFNVVLLKTDENTILAGKNGEMNSIIMAELPQSGDLGEISKGSWISWIEPDQFEESDLLGKEIVAELYRVDDASSLEGQRLVSDTLPIRIEMLKDIVLGGR